jgi:hypothetical protein
MTLHRQIRCQFEGKRQIPFAATHHENWHDREITWALRALAEGFREAAGGAGIHQGGLAG